MNWLEENTRDEDMLRSLDMSLLNQEIVAHGDGLAELVGEHNSRLLAMSERHGKIVEGRKRLADFNVCCDGTVDDLLAEQSRLLRETWGWLQDVRVTVVQREALLHKAQSAIGSLLSDLGRQRNQTVARLSKSMAKTRQKYIEANPYRGAEHFIELLDNDDAVIAIDRQYGKLKADLEYVASLRRRSIHTEPTVLRRQEEVFKHLLN